MEDYVDVPPCHTRKNRHRLKNQMDNREESVKGCCYDRGLESVGYN